MVLLATGWVMCLLIDCPREVTGRVWQKELTEIPLTFIAGGHLDLFFQPRLLQWKANCAPKENHGAVRVGE